MSSLHLQRYNKLINHYQNIIVEGYVEKHHIIPKCLGGSDSLSNLVALPARAHFIAHYLLWKAYPDSTQLAHAFAMMSVSNKHHERIFNSRLYELSKIARSRALKGVPRSEEVKQKLRKPKSNKENYKKPKSQEHRLAISLANKGKKRTQEQIDKNVRAREWYDKKRTEDFTRRKEYYRDLFVKSNMTRKDFAAYHQINYSNMKRYLRGL